MKVLRGVRPLLRGYHQEKVSALEHSCPAHRLSPETEARKAPTQSRESRTEEQKGQKGHPGNYGQTQTQTVVPVHCCPAKTGPLGCAGDRNFGPCLSPRCWPGTFVPLRSIAEGLCCRFSKTINLEGQGCGSGMQHRP